MGLENNKVTLIIALKRIVQRSIKVKRDLILYTAAHLSPSLRVTLVPAKKGCLYRNFFISVAILFAKILVVYRQCADAEQYKRRRTQAKLTVVQHPAAFLFANRTCDTRSSRGRGSRGNREESEFEARIPTTLVRQ